MTSLPKGRSGLCPSGTEVEDEMERGRVRAHGCEQGNRDGWCRKMREKGVSEPVSGGVWGRGRAAMWKW